MRKLLWLPAAVVLALAGCSVAAPPDTVTLAVAGRVSANASIAAFDEIVAVAWAAATEGGSTDIYAAVSRDAGTSFAAPVRVSGAPADAVISGEQPPRVTVVPHAQGQPSIVVLWTARGAAGTRLLTGRSDDGGSSFGPVSVVPGSEAPGNRGWESIATRADGGVVALWLDHRETVGTGMSMAPMQHDGQSHAGHAAPSDGAAKAALSKLYVGLVDGSEAPRAITGGVCYCCKTAIASGADGSLYATWRHVYPGNLRDIAFTLSRDGGRSFAVPTRVSEDQWALDGCPENGPAMAIDARQAIHLVWPTLVADTTAGSEPTLGLFYTASDDGLRFTPRQRLAAEGTPYHPQIASHAADGSLLVVWDELQAGRRRVAAARGVGKPGAGPREFAPVEIATAEAASYPVVAATRRGYVVAWTDGPRTASRIVVQRLP